MDTTFTDSKHRVACPASLDYGDLINSGSIHFSSAAQIAKHGVCRKCLKRMKQHGKAILNGKVEQPADMNEHHHRPDVEQDHVGFSAPGEMVQTTEMDFDEIDRALGLVKETPPDARRQAGELVRQLFAYCFPSQRKLDLRTAAAKLAVIGAGLRPDALNDETQTALAARLGLTKAAMSKASVAFQSAFGVKFSRSRSVSARAKMRARRLGGPARHLKAAPDGQTEDGGTATPAALKDTTTLCSHT